MDADTLNKQKSKTFERDLIILVYGNKITVQILIRKQKIISRSKIKSNWPKQCIPTSNTVLIFGLFWQ